MTWLELERNLKQKMLQLQIKHARRNQGEPKNECLKKWNVILLQIQGRSEGQTIMRLLREKPTETKIMWHSAHQALQNQARTLLDLGGNISHLKIMNPIGVIGCRPSERLSLRGGHKLVNLKSFGNNLATKCLHGKSTGEGKLVPIHL